MTSDDAARTPTRVRDAVLAAFTLACFATASPSHAQVQPGEPTADVPLAQSAEPVAVEIAMGIEDGRIVCRPDRAPLPAGETLTLQIVNGTDAAGAFAAPTLIDEATVASAIDAAYDEAAGAWIVAPGTIGQILFETDQVGEHAFACAGPDTTDPARGAFVVED
ncbi:cupredoxin domain-containing protein [Salinarimonas sp. NSM]|uniref:cupredoxin domain-containing protein n=1 Tax=Salinarimonas sp. NSM TaxID=3458003 RepID=UPI004036F345